MSFESMPRQDLLLAIDSLAQEKMISREIVIESLEAAIAKIAKHKYGEEFNIVAQIDRKNGAIHRCPVHQSHSSLPTGSC